MNLKKVLGYFMAAGLGLFGSYGCSRREELPPAEHYKTLTYFIDAGSTITVRFPASQQRILENALQLSGRGNRLEVALELIAADAHDGNTDGVMNADNVQCFANGTFVKTAEQYAGALPVKDILGGARPKFGNQPPYAIQKE